MQISDGGPAFPRPASDDGSTQASSEPGMSLRDYFAARAMQGYRASDAYAMSAEETIAEWAYRQADAMLKARERA